jgi:hypothetical protein
VVSEALQSFARQMEQIDIYLIPVGRVFTVWYQTRAGNDFINVLATQTSVDGNKSSL